MRLYKAFFAALLTSVLIGTVSFTLIGIFLICDYRTGTIDWYDAEIFIESSVLTYAIIQFFLSSLNMIQAIYYESKGRLNFSDRSIFIAFLFTGYALFVLGLVLAGIFLEHLIFLIVLLVFLPYIICYSISVFIFRYFITHYKLESP